MKTPIPTQFHPIAARIRAARIERVPALAETIAAGIVALWGEIQAPPRPAWLIVAIRSRKQRGEVTLRYAPR